MSETTTTDSQVEPTAEQSQAETTPETAAEATTEETQPDPKGSDESASIADEHLEWLKSKGVDPSDPQAMSKVAEMYRNAEKQMHQASQEAKAKSQLGDASKEAAAGDDLQEIKNELTVIRFYQDHPEARDLDPQMAEIVSKKPWLANDLEDVLTLAKANKHADELKAAETKGRESVKAEIARSSSAQAPRGNASTRTEQSAEQKRLEKFSNWD
jgi:hypothetical protein